MFFASDNAEAWAPEILAALGAVGEGAAPSYGDDPYTAEVTQAFGEIFERDVDVFLVPTGTAANGICLAAMCPPYGAILAHEAAHVQVDECGAPEFFTSGAKIVPVRGAQGKLRPDGVAKALSHYAEGLVHHVQPRALTLTQATECGTAYTPAEIEALAEVARSRGMKIHMDGARFANALVHLGCSPAEMSWKAGVDALSFGATKNGCMAAEAIVVFDNSLSEAMPYLRKRAGHLFSKHRFLAAQMQAYLKDGLWLRLAGHANEAARYLAQGLSGHSGVKLWYPVEANQVFVSFEGDLASQLTAAGAHFHPWYVPGDPCGGTMQRLVTSFRTRKEDIDKFLDEVRRLTP